MIPDPTPHDSEKTDAVLAEALAPYGVTLPKDVHEAVARALAEEREAHDLRVSRTLALVERAIDSSEGAAAVRRETGGNAPELVQGILDGIEAVRREERAAGFEEWLTKAEDALTGLRLQALTLDQAIAALRALQPTAARSR